MTGPVLKLLGLVVLTGGAARAFVAFALWRTSFRKRLTGTDRLNRGDNGELWRRERFS